MDHARRKFLAASRFTSDMDGGLTACHALDQGSHMLNGRRLTEQPDGGCRVLRSIKTGEFQCRLHQTTQLLQRHRLGNVIKCARLQRTYGVLGTAMRGDDGNGQIVHRLADMTYQLQAITVGQPHIRQAKVITVARQQSPGFRQRPGTISLKTHSRQRQIKQLANIRFIVND